MRLGRSGRRSWGTSALLAVSMLLLATVTADTTATSDSVTTTSTSATPASTTSTSVASTSTTSTTDSTTTSGSTTTTSDSLPTLPTSSTSTTANSTSSSSTTYSYPPPSVPPTADAPYMQKSNLPEGTVFIAVGSALALMGLIMIVWRLAVAWWINRSVQRAATASYHPQDTKSSLLHSRKKSGMYAQTPDSNLSLDKLGKENRRQSVSLLKHQTPNSSLFFSPTAGAGMHTTGNSRPASGYLPSGYYNSGNLAPGNGLPMTQIGGPPSTASSRRPPSSSISFPAPFSDNATSNSHPSPDFPPSSTRFPGQESTTTLSTMPGSRTPSHYLDDLMSVPPLPPPPGDHQLPSSRGGRREDSNTGGRMRGDSGNGGRRRRDSSTDRFH